MTLRNAMRRFSLCNNMIKTLFLLVVILKKKLLLFRRIYRDKNSLNTKKKISEKSLIDSKNDESELKLWRWVKYTSLDRQNGVRML